MTVERVTSVAGPRGAIPVLQVSPGHDARGAVLVMHGLGSTKETQVKELRDLAQAGFSAVGVDAPHHGARHSAVLDAIQQEPTAPAHEKFLGLVLEAVEELPVLVDFAAGLGGRAVGMLGISMGAYITLAAVLREPRLRAAVSLLGSPDWRPWRGEPTARALELMAQAPQHRALELASRHVLLVNAGQDVNVPPQGARALAGELKGTCVRYVEYPRSTHFMRPEDWDHAWLTSMHYLGRHLG